ncbi:MAG: hypothetical protein ACYSU7_00725 [Planctomycetota bacterium]|jgi:hypothetical protein
MQSDPNRPGPPDSPRIQHKESMLKPGGGVEPAPAPPARDPAPLPVATGVGQVAATKKITAFGKEARHEEKWARTPNLTGQGAIHVRTFHSKITEDALTYMDQTINEWLDAHPQYEVKFVNSTVGILSGKLKEPALLCQVWV